jgi:acyl-CoA synthetase (AMP-forming)/AMP-acid ligase II
MDSQTSDQLNVNFVQRFIEHSQAQPEKLALHISQMNGCECVGEEKVSYGELANSIKTYQALWQKKGWQTNDRIIVIIKPSSQLYAIALSLLALGMTPVFIDTGMGREKIKMAIEDANARAIISMESLLKWFWLIPPMWKLERLAIDGSGLGFQSLTKQVVKLKPDHQNNTINVIERSDTDHGLISFTSGSTGRPKGADRTHYSLIQQHLAIRSHWPDEKNDIDCPCFPVMVLHNLSCGMSTVMPKVDLAQPAQVDAGQVIQQIEQYQITRISGAPAYIQKLVDYSLAHHKTNASVTSLVVGGATVSVELAQGILAAFPNAYSRIVYGSTEAEPISSIELNQYLKYSQTTRGYLVGKPAEQVEILIANVPAQTASEDDLLKHKVSCAEVGEILVSGRHVLKQYVDNPSANAENKIRRTQNNINEHHPIWHRTGDTGFLDDTGKLWLTGRVKDSLVMNQSVIQPYPLEQSMDAIKGIVRSALIEFNHALYVFVQSGKASSHTLSSEIRCEIEQILVAAGIHCFHINMIEDMPVDARHNSKIDRMALRHKLKQ